MRIERVHIGAFGPFHDRDLELAPGLTLVFGPNEAGKSSWHAALYAALCGVRRGGGLTTDYRELAAAHRPWNGGGWQASVVLMLADGRRVEVRQDLERRVGSARDLALGHELTPEIVNEGTPDCSRWLGLDRRSFLATACVRQADVLDVHTRAGALQGHIQRAAATGGADETAAQALDVLAEFERERVGVDRANSTRPLRLAVNRVEQAGRALEATRQRQREYLAHVEEAGRLACQAAARDRDRLRLEAAVTRSRAAQWMSAAVRARELNERYPGPAAPALQAEADQARRATDVLSAYRGLAPDAPLVGASVRELQAQLDLLPDPPVGELSPDHAVNSAYMGWDGADRALVQHDRRQPPEAPAPATPVPPARLREIATELEALATLADSSGRASRQPRPWPGIVLGGMLAIGGVIMALLGLSLPGTLAVVAGIGLAAVMVVHARSVNLRALRAEEAARRLTVVEADARRLSVPADPARLRALAADAEAAEMARRAVQEWHAVRVRLVDARTEAAKALGSVLAEHGTPARSDLRDAYQGYEAACAVRHAQAVEAGRRPGLEEAIRQRREREREAEDRARRRHEVVNQLRDTALSCGVAAGAEGDLVRGLEVWLQGRDEELRRREHEVRGREELRSLLAGGTIADLEARAERYRDQAERLMAPFDPAELDAIELGSDTEGRLAELTEVARQARTLADHAHGEVRNWASLVPSVAGAEEELAHAEVELNAVRELARVISLTRRFLQEAQERVHRDIAPVLKRTLEAWLPGVTGGRYSDVIVTPETLQVRVRATNGEWRDADRLSQGTREQVYLLLRLALVEHLTRQGETCPLILDDVTVQSDAARKAAVLDLLHRISRERQVVLFSQEDDVRAWAEAHLDPAVDGLVRLDPGLVPA